MQVTVPVVDFGDILLEKSESAPSCVRMTLNDEVAGKNPVYFDLDKNEIRRLISGLDFISRHEVKND